MIHQLRTYEIFEENKEAFHARFRDHAARIMDRHGFQIIAMWEAKTEKRTEFVYLLRWPDEQTKTAAWTSFMADQINAVSPVAATRVLRRSAPELTPDLVAPGVAFLASSACGLSGAVLNAAGGRFSLSWWGRSDGVDLGLTVASPEDVACRWQEIASQA